MSMPTGRFASRRLLAGIAAVFAASAFAAAFAALATPALAEEPTLPGADLSVNVPGPKISLKTAAKTVRVDITNVGPDTASDARVTIQVADVSDAVEVVLPGNANCTESPGTVSCPLGDLPARAHEYSLPVAVLPADDAKAGAVAKLTVTVSSGIDDPDPANNTQTVQLELVDEVVDLLAFGAGDVTLNPGQTKPLAYTVSNDGGVDAEAVDVAVRLPRYVTFADALGNDPDVECEVVDHRSGAICHIGRLPANAAAPAAALNVTLAKHAPADSPSITVIITAPTGTEIVDAPHCDPVAPGRIVKCEAPLAAGDGFAEEVKFKITSSTVGNDGTAVVSGPLADPNLDNNTAAIKITVLPSGEPGGLPVTGVKVAVIGAVGLAGVVVGWLLFAATRRRRVVMVTPGDETTEK